MFWVFFILALVLLALSPALVAWILAVVIVASIIIGLALVMGKVARG